MKGCFADEPYAISLNQGWNLIGHPLVSKVLVDSLEIIDPNNFYGVPMTWDQAVSSQLLMPSSIHGFDNELKMHTPVDVLSHSADTGFMPLEI